MTVIVIITPTTDFIECFFSWATWNLDQNSWDFADCLFSTGMAYHFEYSSIFSLFPLEKYIFEFFFKTGQISEYPNLNEILDPAVVNALYEGGYKQKKVQFQDFELVLTEYRNT